MITFREAVSSAGGCLFNTKSEEEGKNVELITPGVLHLARYVKV
jgi:hypothetical protein